MSFNLLISQTRLSVNKLDSCCKNFFRLVERMSASKYGWNSIGSTLINQSVLVAGWLLWGSQAGSAAFLSDMWCVIIGDICHTPTRCSAEHYNATQRNPADRQQRRQYPVTLLAHWHSSAPLPLMQAMLSIFKGNACVWNSLWIYGVPLTPCATRFAIIWSWNSSFDKGPTIGWHSFCSF